MGLCSLPIVGPEVAQSWSLQSLCRAIGSVAGLTGELLQKDLCQHTAPLRTDGARTPDPEAGHCLPIPLRETPKYSQACLAQSLVGLLLLSPRS